MLGGRVIVGKRERYEKGRKRDRRVSEEKVRVEDGERGGKMRGREGKRGSRTSGGTTKIQRQMKRVKQKKESIMTIGKARKAIAAHTSRQAFGRDEERSWDREEKSTGDCI